VTTEIANVVLFIGAIVLVLLYGKTCEGVGIGRDTAETVRRAELATRSIDKKTQEPKKAPAADEVAGLRVVIDGLEKENATLRRAMSRAKADLDVPSLPEFAEKRAAEGPDA